MSVIFTAPQGFLAAPREGLAALEGCFGPNLAGVDINTVSPPHDVGA